MLVSKFALRAAIAVAILSSGVSAQAALNGSLDTTAGVVHVEQHIDLLAKKGADDPKGDDRKGRGRGRDDGPNHTLIQTNETFQVARKGADDAPGHVRRGRGADDAPGDTRRGRGTDDAKPSGRRA